VELMTEETIMVAPYAVWEYSEGHVEEVERVIK